MSKQALESALNFSTDAMRRAAMLLSQPISIADLPRLILQEDFEQITDQIVLPLTLIVGEQMITVVSREMAKNLLAAYRKRLKAAGALAVFSRLVSEQALDSGRSLQISHSIYLDGDGNRLGDSLVRATSAPNEFGLGLDLIRFVRTPAGIELKDLVPEGAIR